MTAVKLASLEAFLRKPSSSIGAILFYGADPIAIRELAATSVRRTAGSLDDPFRVVVIDDSELSSDPGRLVDLVKSQSLLGGSQVIWLQSAEQAFLRAAAGILDGSVQGNLVIAEAGNLAKGSALRRRFEESKHVHIIPVYEQEPADAELVVRTALSAEGFATEQEAITLLLAAAGSGTALLMREVEKLAAYCKGRSTVVAEDVRAVCGVTSEIETDDLVDATFAGNIDEVDRCFQQLVHAAIDPSRLLAAALAHATRLLDSLRNIDRGMRAEQAIRATQPPLFFKRQAIAQIQMSIWTLDALLSVAATLNGAVCQSRLNSKLAGEIANRTLVAIARIPRSKRRPRN